MPRCSGLNPVTQYKKIGISYSVGWKSWQLKSNLPALLHRGSLACLLTHMLGFTLFDLLMFVASLCFSY